MTVKKKRLTDTPVDKKTRLDAIRQQLANVLKPILKKELGKKKFDKRVRKAAKVLTAGIKKGGDQQTDNKSTTIKKRVSSTSAINK